jgi:hypothetical protein
MTPGFAQSRDQLPWLYYPESDRVIINAHNFPSSSFDPSQIATAVWLDGSDASTLYDAVSGGSLVASNGTIARWEDKSGNARHVTQSTSGSRPTRKTAIQNGLDAVLLDGGDWMENTSAAALPNNAKTIIAAVKSTNAVGGTIWNNIRATSNTLRFVARLLRLGGISYIAGDTTTVNTTTTQNFSTEFQSPFVVSWTENSSRTIAFWTNGTSRSTSGSPAAEASITGFRIGSLLEAPTGNPIQLFPGYFYEIIAIDAEASTSDRQKIEGYLAWKWDTVSALDASHPYKSVAP